MSTTQSALEDRAMNAPALDTDAIDAFDEAGLYDDTPTPEAKSPAPAPEPEPAPKAAPAPAPKAEEPKPEGKPDAPVVDDEQHDDKHMMPAKRYLYQRDKRLAAEKQAEELREQNEELQRQLEEARKTQEAASNNQQQEVAKQIDTLETQIGTLLEEAEQMRQDGNFKGAAQNQAQVNRINRQIAKLEAEPPPNIPQVDVDAIQRQSAAYTHQMTELQGVIDEAYKVFPQLDDKNTDVFDADATQEVLDVYNAVLPRSASHASAMQRAIRYVMGDPPATPAVPPRKQEAVARNTAEAAKIPPDIASAGHNSDTGGARRPLDISRMSIEEFEKLGDLTETEEFLSS